MPPKFSVPRLPHEDLLLDGVVCVRRMTLTPCLCHLAADVEPPEPQLTPSEYFGWNLEEPAQRNSSSPPTSALPRFAHAVSPQNWSIDCSAESHVPLPVCLWVRCNFLCSVPHSLQLHGVRRMRIRNLQRLSEIPLQEVAREEEVGGAVDTLHRRVYVLVTKSTRVCVCFYAYGDECLCARPCVHGISLLMRECCAPWQMSSLSSPQYSYSEAPVPWGAQGGGVLHSHPGLGGGGPPVRPPSYSGRSSGSSDTWNAVMDRSYDAIPMRIRIL